MLRTPEALLLSLFKRQARALVARAQYCHLEVTAEQLAGRVVDDACRHISRARLQHDRLQGQLEVFVDALLHVPGRRAHEPAALAPLV